jgi:outer membrane receptor protein involved in Fe transport
MGPFPRTRLGRLRLRVSGLGIAAVLAWTAGAELFSAQILAAQTSLRLHGEVRDQKGTPVAGATISADCAQFHARQLTADDGTFAFDAPADCSGKLEVSAAGFAQARLNFTADEAGGEAGIAITLNPAPLYQSVSVTATRAPVADANAEASTSTVTSLDLENWAGLSVDDKLRQVAGFSLYRRSGSETANPTTQGVSLRGLGANGASRALVLVDGVPLNDPFGGWVFWDQVPEQEIDRIEVVEGGVSDLYGSTALGGVVQIETKPPLATSLSLESSLGNELTAFTSARAVLRSDVWAISINGEGFRSDGYILVPADLRGSVDSNASSKHASGDVRIERTVAESLRVFLQASLLGENRLNGTDLQVNNNTIRQLAAGADWDAKRKGLFTIRVFGGTENYHQTFSSVAANQNSETLASNQNVPVYHVGFSAQWTRTFARRHSVAIGVDGRDIVGESDELRFSAGLPTSTFDNGGRQHETGVFIEDVFAIRQKWQLSLSAREDFWANLDGSSIVMPVNTGIGAIAPSTTIYPNRSENFFSPRASVSRQITRRIVLHASAYRAFRAPTLNELYRPFRVGNVLTNANAGLTAEHFTGGEAGAEVHLWGERLRIRGAFFDGYIDDPVANVTLTSTPTLITRQRENLGSTRSIGFELHAEARLTQRMFLSAGYEYVNADVVSFPAGSSLVGLRVPLVPRHDFTAEWSYTRHAYAFAVQGRAEGEEFDDDLNQYRLPPYFVLSASLSRTFGERLEVFVAGDNLFNSRYAVSETPTPTLGSPILVRGGVRLQLSSKQHH